MSSSAFRRLACLLIPLTRPISRAKRVILEFIEAERLECDSRGDRGGGTKNRYVNRFGIRARTRLEPKPVAMKYSWNFLQRVILHALQGN